MKIKDYTDFYKWKDENLAKEEFCSLLKTGRFTPETESNIPLFWQLNNHPTDKTECFDYLQNFILNLKNTKVIEKLTLKLATSKPSDNVNLGFLSWQFYPIENKIFVFAHDWNLLAGIQVTTNVLLPNYETSRVDNYFSYRHYISAKTYENELSKQKEQYN